jgi:hypothetical protein
MLRGFYQYFGIRALRGFHTFGSTSKFPFAWSESKASAFFCCDRIFIFVSVPTSAKFTKKVASRSSGDHSSCLPSPSDLCIRMTLLTSALNA